MNMLLSLVNEKVKTESEISDQRCQKCGGAFANFNFCRECRNAIQSSCLGCGFKVWDDVHEFCYCQLELFANISKANQNVM